VNGVADLGFALAARFVDPHDNWIGLLQLKKPNMRPPGARHTKAEECTVTGTIASRWMVSRTLSG
jgi:hypothetical protein